MFGIIIRPMAWILEQLYGLIGNYGITLIIFTVVVKLILYPFYKKQILSMANMGDMQKKMKEIQKKYGDDKEVYNQKLAELYRENGNPMGGCLPAIVQMVVISILFTILRNPLLYMTSTEMKFAVHENFLWIRDLSQPDLWILPIITGLATFFAFLMNSRNGLNGGMPQQNGSNALNGIMKYFFPLLLTYMARTYPAGLAIYWSMGQVVQIFFNIRFNQLKRKMNEEKEKANRKKKVVRRA